jgi:hypothetical protein
MGPAFDSTSCLSWTLLLVVRMKSQEPSFIPLRARGQVLFLYMAVKIHSQEEVCCVFDK